MSEKEKKNERESKEGFGHLSRRAFLRDALGGNLCRCGTYQQHPPTVLEAAEALKRS
jgi:aerobic-type carbon monoxide dehydrogenase small subunit (CoxS/CutS family)